MKLRGLKCVLAACIACFIWSTAAEAQQCLTNPTLAEAIDWLDTPPHPAIPGWNVRVATYNFSASGTAPTGTIATAFQNAINAWNSLVCQTGIAFVPSGGAPADLEFRRTNINAEADNCITYNRPGNDIIWGPAFESRTSALGLEQTTGVVIHEIGHFLGLTHTFGPITVMTPISSCPSPLFETQLTVEDGQKVGECLQSAPNCSFFIFFPITPFECEQAGGYWNFNFGACYDEPQLEPCVDCIGNEDCCYGDVCHNGACGPPEVYCPPCPPDTVCVEGLCSYATPILIDVDGDGFNMTNKTGGVEFDFDGDGLRQRLPWTAAGSDDAWLVMDRNHNGQIDSGREMFGNVSPQSKVPDKEKNGFISLAEFDKTKLGGNEDAVISNRDYFFRSLRLWTDTNHNGISEATELRSLDQAGIDVVELEYKLSSRSDRNGNLFRYRAKVTNANGAQLGRWAWDVIFNGRGNQK
jgi:hypothetical protein